MVNDDLGRKTRALPLASRTIKLSREEAKFFIMADIHNSELNKHKEDNPSTDNFTCSVVSSQNDDEHRSQLSFCLDRYCLCNKLQLQHER